MTNALRIAALAALVACIAPCALLAADASTTAPSAAPATVDAALREADLLMTGGGYAAAARLLSQASAREPKDVRLLESLAVAQVFSGDSAGALATLKSVPAEPSPSPSVLLWSAVAADASGDSREAAALLAEGLAAAGDDETTLYDLAERFLRAGAPSVSARLYAKVLSVLPKDTMFDLYSRLHLAAHHSLSGRNAESARLIGDGRRAFEYSDIDVLVSQEVEYLVSYYAGLALIEEGKRDEGISKLRDAAAIFPLGVIADGEVVRQLAAAGRAEEADALWALLRKRFEAAVAAAPEKHEAWFDLAVVCHAAGRDFDRGLEAAKWAVRIAPLRAEYMDMEAALLFDLKRNDEALLSENRAIAMMSGLRWAEAGLIDGYVRRRLDILRALGVPAPARSCLSPTPSPADVRLSPYLTTRFSVSAVSSISSPCLCASVSPRFPNSSPPSLPVLFVSL